MRKFFNKDDIINITCFETSKLSGKSAYSILRRILRKDNTNKWLEASKTISGEEIYAKDIESIYNYVSVLCEISNQGCETGVSPEKKSVKDIDSLEHFYKNIGYKHDETGENWNGPDSADLYDAQEKYNIAKKALINI